MTREKEIEKRLREIRPDIDRFFFDYEFCEMIMVLSSGEEMISREFHEGSEIRKLMIEWETILLEDWDKNVVNESYGNYNEYDEY